MVRSLLLDGARIAVVAGHAGTGKTFALHAAHQQAWTADFEVLGAAIARRPPPQRRGRQWPSRGRQ